ncbi:hypothetical protein [Nodularia spumigena]|uniref:hypothetical protein n=1 Tax=Nodularia spumigena TaxID=70799 RepID=UPI002B21FB00|nr:hypothetical protein [Nodularia spumigena]MEA5614574.1 hypothetical protein [Nodularia spumigena UHCC 0040]
MAHADVVYQNGFESGAAGAEWSNQKVSSIASPWGTFLGNFGQETVRLTLGRGSDDGSGGGEPGGQGGTDGPVVGGGLVGRPIGTGRGGGGGGDGNFGSLPSQKTGMLWYSGGNGGGGGGGGGGDPGVGAGSYSLFFDLHLFDTWDGWDGTFGVDRFKVAVNGREYFNQVLETFEPWENALGGWTIPGNHAYNPQYRDLTYANLEIRFDVATAGQLLEIDFIGAANQNIYDEAWGLDNVRVEFRGSGRAVPSTPTGVVVLGGLLAAARRRR